MVPFIPCPGKDREAEEDAQSTFPMLGAGVCCLLVPKQAGKKVDNTQHHPVYEGERHAPFSQFILSLVQESRVAGGVRASLAASLLEIFS